jgi:hypothetical protein
VMRAPSEVERALRVLQQQINRHSLERSVEEAAELRGRQPGVGSCSCFSLFVRSTCQGGW